MERGDDIFFQVEVAVLSCQPNLSLCAFLLCLACWLYLFCLMWLACLPWNIGKEPSKTGEELALACAAVMVKWSVGRQQLRAAQDGWLAGRAGADSWFSMFHNP